MTSPELEKYLFRLDKALSGIPVSDKAEIVTEIKSHILDAMDRDPSQSLQSVLDSLGEPEQVANKYLLEKGLKAGRAPKHPIIKWIIIGFLSTFGMLIAFLIFLLLHFTPLIMVDKTSGEVSLLGGAIQIQDESVSFYDLEDYQPEKNSNIHLVTEAIPYSNDNPLPLQLRFDFGRVELTEDASQQEIVWTCKTKQNNQSINAKNMAGVLLIDFTKLGDVDCSVQVPDLTRVSVQGMKGSVFYIKPKK
jgi:hypothetical protein